MKRAKLSLQQVVEAHTIVRRRGCHIGLTIGSQMVMFSALRAGRLLPPGRFLVLIYVRVWWPQGHSAAGKITSIEKKSNDLNENRSLDLPTCNTVPHPSTLLSPQEEEEEEGGGKQGWSLIQHTSGREGEGGDR
jgi:hypothetical protein